MQADVHSSGACLNLLIACLIAEPKFSPNREESCLCDLFLPCDYPIEEPLLGTLRFSPDIVIHGVNSETMLPMTVSNKLCQAMPNDHDHSSADVVIGDNCDMLACFGGFSGGVNTRHNAPLGSREVASSSAQGPHMTFYLHMI